MESFLSVLDHIPADSRLIYVGDGDLKAGLKDQLAKVNVRQHSPDKLDERIQFTGHISDFNALSKLYARSLFSVSPGYAGLSLTQSLGFGVPALISKNEDHAPEIEAAKEGFNAVFYETDDVADLSSKIIEVFDKKDLWIKKREEISQDCRSSYSVESMAEPFLNLIKS